MIRLSRTFACAVLTAAYVGTVGCGPSPAPRVEGTPASLEKLSQYGLFVGQMRDQRPAPGVIPYDLNTPLFSDYAEKSRFVKLPPGSSARYHEDDVFSFPVGTVLAKTFAYPIDARDPSRGRRLLETRVLVHQADGWVGLPYVWDEAQEEATLEVAGRFVDVAWVHTDGHGRANNYIVPNMNQCKGCHKVGESVVPLGPRARQLNKEFLYEQGTENQLTHWSRAGVLSGAKRAVEAPRLAVWDDPTSGTLEARARAWLEINCAHCHSPEGPARNSGLDLLSTQKTPAAYGVFKAPVAAGLGSGGRAFDIVPGRPDESILTYRIASTHPGVMMPELGKRLVHEEGVALVREWVASMSADPRPTAENR